jgi:hypothetical protein
MSVASDISVRTIGKCTIVVVMPRSPSSADSERANDSSALLLARYAENSGIGIWVDIDVDTTTWPCP